MDNQEKYTWHNVVKIDEFEVPPNWRKYEYKHLLKLMKLTRSVNNNLKRKLKLKTRMCWIATEYMLKANLMPGKTQTDIYELLKMLAEKELLAEEQQETVDENKNS